MDVILLSLDDTRRIVRQVGVDALMDRMIDELTRALAGFDEADVTIPVRAGIEYDAPHVGLLEWMPIAEAGGSMTLKTVGYHPENPRAHGLPTILSTVNIFDTRTGRLTGVIDGTFLTALRTGAASAVASRVLARRDSQTLGLIGCGAQAVTQFHALSRVFDIRQIVAFDTDEEAAASLPGRLRPLLDASAPPSYRVATMREVVASADILCTQTSVAIGQGPVFDDREAKPWLHVNAVGSDFPGKTEAPRRLLERSLVCPDFKAQAVREGECQQLPADQVGPDLVELVRHAGRFQAHQQKTTVFDSTGWALEDHVAGRILLDCAQRLGIGEHVTLACISADPKDPYGFLRDTPRPRRHPSATEPPGRIDRAADHELSCTS